MTGGGIINRKSLSILLLLLTIALPLNIGAISAATTNQTNINLNLNQSLSTNIGQNSTQTVKKSRININTSNNLKSTPKTAPTQNFAAAGTVKKVAATTTVTISLGSINSAANVVQKYIKTYHKLPNYVTLSGKKITLPQFLYLLTSDLLKVNSKSTAPVTLKSVKSPTINTVETVKIGNLKKTEYINLANRIYNYINKYGTPPASVTSSLGRIRYESLIYTYSKILGFYGTNKRLPGYVSTNPGTITFKQQSTSPVVYTPPTIPADIKPYLDPTNNCQSDSSVIKALATSITKGLTSPKDRATAIFNWVRDNIQYSFYYNTQKGALGTLSARTANCVDTSHLMIALQRAAGNPAKYEHVYAQFPSGTWYGHVIALVYIGGVWYKTDGTSSRNQFGVVNNWNTATASIKGVYKELPF